MTTEIRIHLEGDTPGLAEHRVSLTQFGPALRQLVRLIRRTASGVFREGVSAEYGERGGRLAREAAMLDVQLGRIEEGSVVLPLLLALNVSASGQLPLELPLLTAQVLLSDIDVACNRGQGRAIVQRYVDALPRSVSAHTYELVQDGTVRHTVRVETRPEVEVGVPVPFLREIRGQVARVGWLPHEEVHIKDSGGTRGYRANRDQVAHAISLHEAEVCALVVVGLERRRLLWLRPAGERPQPGPQQERIRAVLGEWGELLQRLAR